MLAILPMLDKLLVYNILNLRVLIILVATLSRGQCHRNGEKRLMSQKMDSIFEKYMNVVRRLSDDFPNHQIELHLDIAGDDPPKPQNRVNYIYLREPAQLNGHYNGKPKTQGNQLPKSMLLARTDPDMAPVYMKDLRSAVEEMEKKYNNIRATNDTALTPQEPDIDINMKPILDILRRGVVVDTINDKPPGDNTDNMKWLQIKIPKNI